jgi:hypothetical protein
MLPLHFSVGEHVRGCRIAARAMQAQDKRRLRRFPIRFGQEQTEPNGLPITALELANSERCVCPAGPPFCLVLTDCRGGNRKQNYYTDTGIAGHIPNPQFESLRLEL